VQSTKAVAKVSCGILAFLSRTLNVRWQGTLYRRCSQLGPVHISGLHKFGISQWALVTWRPQRPFHIWGPLPSGARSHLTRVHILDPFTFYPFTSEIHSPLRPIHNRDPFIFGACSRDFSELTRLNIPQVQCELVSGANLAFLLPGPARAVSNSGHEPQSAPPFAAGRVLIGQMLDRLVPQVR
jgi:hypothetical protein